MGKKLLLLGGTNMIEDICKYIDKETVIFAASNQSNTPIERKAKKFFNVSTVDNEAISQIIFEEKIDGVFLGGNETVISANVGLMERLGLPCYVSEEAWNRTSNKVLFKEACRAVGVPVSEEYTVDSNIKFPVVVKPVDASGSRGVTLCKTRDELDACIKYAKGSSKTETVLIEEYLSGQEIAAHYSIINGVAKLSSISDKYENTHCGEFNPIADAYAYPSKIRKLFMEKYDKKIQALFKYLNVRQGIAFIQGFHCNGKIKFFEMGYRIPGTLTYRYADFLNGTSGLKNILDYSLHGKCDDTELVKENADFKKYCCTLTMLLRPGIVGSISGLEAARNLPGVLRIDSFYKSGDEVRKTNSASQFGFFAFIYGDTVQQLRENCNAVQNQIGVRDINGEEMLYADFDTNRLQFGE